MDLIKRFADPEKKYSALAFWFWNGTLNPDFLAWQIDQMTDKGIYGGFMHARAYLKTPYFGDGWWKAIDRCITQAQKDGFSLWLYDEYAWPSGTAGSIFDYGYQSASRVLACGECNMAKGLSVTVIPNTILPDKKKLIASFKTEDGQTLAFYRHVYPRSVDYLNKDTIRDFIQYTHEEYKNHYGKYFGNLIPGIFFDEIFMAGNPFPWTDRLPDEFKKRCGYDLLKVLPCLVTGKNEQTYQVRNDYYRTVAELYEEAFFAQIGNWCSKNGLKLTGHTEENFILHPRRQGNYFNTMRHLALPGADNHDYRYKLPRKITYCEPKYSVSVSRMYRRERAMAEAMGGAGWGCSLQEFKRGINVLGAMGISMFILHGFYNECEHQGSQGDWPASFFYQNPYWKYFKKFSDYIRRISYMNSQGRPVVDIGLFYPIRELYRETETGNPNQNGITLSHIFDSLLTALLEHQMDTDMFDWESLCNADVKEGALQIGAEAFRVLIFPSSFIPDATVIKTLTVFSHEGGRIICYPLENEKKQSELLKIPGCVVCTSEKIPALLAQSYVPDIKVLEDDTGDFYSNHRIFGDTDYYMVVNGRNQERNVTVWFRCQGSVSRLNPETGKTEQISVERQQQGSRIRLHLTEDEACFLIFRNKEQPVLVSSLMRTTAVLQLSGNWKFKPLDDSYKYQTDFSRQLTKLKIPLAVFTSETGSGTHPETIRIQNRTQESGFCGRYLSPWTAFWITRRPGWTEDLGIHTLYFRKSFDISDNALNARLCIAAEKKYTLYLNGKQVGTGNHTPDTWNILSYTQKGKNLLAISVENDTPMMEPNYSEAEQLPAERLTSLLVEGEIQTNTDTVSIISDRSWIVNGKYRDGWNILADCGEKEAVSIDPETARTQAAVCPADTWIYAWERGRPPLLPWGQLPLWGNSVMFPQNISYTVTIPAGSVAIQKPDTDSVCSFLLDGRKVSFQEPVLHVENDDRTHLFQIFLRAESLQDGLRSPIAVIVDFHNAILGDWRAKGLDWFSGYGEYVTTLKLKKEPSCRYILDLGKVHFSAEVSVNGEFVDTRIWAPYHFDITGNLVDGDNSIDIVVSNSAAVERRHMLVDEGMALGWNRYWNEENIDREPQNLVSGLPGPILILVMKHDRDIGTEINK